MLLQRRYTKRLAVIALAAFFAYHLITFIFPPDTHAFLLVHWLGVCFRSFLHPVSEVNDWLLRSSTGPHPIDFSSRVGFLIKTGYGTRTRLPAQLEGLGLGRGYYNPEKALVVGDFASEDIGGAPVRDVVGELVEYLEKFGHRDAPRFAKYRELKGYIESGNEQKALEFGKKIGWELDAMKFIWSLGALYESIPEKDWYLILDDDSYLIPQTLVPFLSHFDPNVPHYIGNSVGHFTARFAHGGSVIVLSRAALEVLYHQHPDVVHKANVETLGEKFGDSLVAKTMQRVGIFIDERFNHLFNGENPAETRIWADRFCAPLASFHELKTPEQARETREKMSKWRGFFMWSDTWEVFGGPDFRGFKDQPMREGWDHIGRLKGETRSSARGKGDVEWCKQTCLDDHKGCLAWKWDKNTRECNTTPWMSIGFKADHLVSGINGAWAEELRAWCKTR